MTLQTVVSAHAAAGALVIRKSCQCKVMQNSRQAGSSCIVCLSLAQPGASAGQRQAGPSHTTFGQFIGVPVMQ